MNCQKYLPLIDDLAEGEIDAQIAKQINLHIFACEPCSVYYRNLKQEKEIYARYLFDVEPPTDLWQKFQTKINAEPFAVSQIPESSDTAAKLDLSVFKFFRLYPAVAAAAVLVALGIGFLKISSDKTVSVNQYAVRQESNDMRAINDSSGETIEKPATDLSKNTNLNSNLIASKKFVKSDENSTSANYKPGKGSTNKIVAVKSFEKNERTPLVDGEKEKILTGEKIPTGNQPNEKQLEQLQMKALESETAQQIEKTELLLRSFRNAREVDGGSIYDVGYEKQQARKLLEKNVRLRQIAENYGSLYTREILDKVEPFLLDIANLENNPAANKVLDIKERVRNQNIIASLQVY